MPMKAKYKSTIWEKCRNFRKVKESYGILMTGQGELQKFKESQRKLCIIKESLENLIEVEKGIRKFKRLADILYGRQIVQRQIVRTDYA